MYLNVYLTLKKNMIKMGFQKDIEFYENLKPPVNEISFFIQYLHVVLNSGMKNEIANKIFDKIIAAINNNIPISKVFNHKGKVKAINIVWSNMYEIFRNYELSFDKLKYLESLPYIGKITKYHLAKNIGFDCCKPDRHLLRIAKKYKTTPEKLCKKLSELSGDKIAVVDVVLWRSGNLGIL